jgi:hypothetical protein
MPLWWITNAWYTHSSFGSCISQASGVYKPDLSRWPHLCSRCRLIKHCDMAGACDVPDCVIIHTLHLEQAMHGHQHSCSGLSYAISMPPLIIVAMRIILRAQSASLAPPHWSRIWATMYRICKGSTQCSIDAAVHQCSCSTVPKPRQKVFVWVRCRWRNLLLALSHPEIMLISSNTQYLACLHGCTGKTSNGLATF